MNKTMELRLQFYLSTFIAILGYFGVALYVKLNDYTNLYFYISIGLLTIGTILTIRDGKRFFKHLQSQGKCGSDGCLHSEYWKHDNGKLYCIKCGDEVKQK